MYDFKFLFVICCVGSLGGATKTFPSMGHFGEKEVFLTTWLKITGGRTNCIVCNPAHFRLRLCLDLYF